MSAEERYLALVTEDPIFLRDTNGSFDIYGAEPPSRLLSTLMWSALSLTTEALGPLPRAFQYRIISIGHDGSPANHFAAGPSITADGRYVAYYSRASNLVAVDTNPQSDVFVCDQIEKETTLVSVASDERQADNYCRTGEISADGTAVVFVSAATNLVAGDTNFGEDVFVRDLVAGTTTRVSVASDGTEANGWSGNPAISGNGRHVVFDSYATNLMPNDRNGQQDVYLHDRETRETIRLWVAADGSEGNGGSINPDISDNAVTVAFESDATNLVPDDTNGVRDIFCVSALFRNTLHLPLTIRS